MEGKSTNNKTHVVQSFASIYSKQIDGVPDVGKFLYRKVHFLHHKSYNPTAFSGTSMHVVEATLYYSAGMVPVLVAGLHPVVALAWIIDCAVGAWLGHDGFQVRSKSTSTTTVKKQRSHERHVSCLMFNFTVAG